MFTWTARLQLFTTLELRVGYKQETTLINQQPQMQMAI